MLWYAADKRNWLSQYQNMVYAKLVTYLYSSIYFQVLDWIGYIFLVWLLMW